MDQVEKETNRMVARGGVAYLPIYLENKAITMFHKSDQGSIKLRTMAPEILTPAEEAH